MASVQAHFVVLSLSQTTGAPVVIAAKIMGRLATMPSSDMDRYSGGLLVGRMILIPGQCEHKGWAGI